MIETEDQLLQFISQPFEAQALQALAEPMEATEVVISTFPKCGTNWAAQITHGLRSAGDFSFGNISEVFPWFENGYRFGHDLSRPQKFSPHLFKSHMQLSELPAGGKVINIVRNPGDTLVSYYNFWSGVLFDPDVISIEMMARQLFLMDRSSGPRNMFRLNYYQHLVDFHSTKYDGQVLYIAYEDMKLNLSTAVRRIARFIGLDPSRALQQKVVEQATFEFMSRHREKYQERVPGGVLEMVVTGRVGDSKQKISAELQSELDEAWQRYVTPMLGYENYDQLLDSISRSR